jgi:ATP-dependent protease ClpP protease subunit
VAGKKRFAFNHSSLLIHSGSAQLQGTAEQINESAKKYKDQIAQMKDYILERTEIPEKVFNKNKKDDWYLTTKEIKDYKIADIVTSLDEIV